MQVQFSLMRSLRSCHFEHLNIQYMIENQLWFFVLLFPGIHLKSHGVVLEQIMLLSHLVFLQPQRRPLHILRFSSCIELISKICWSLKNNITLPMTTWSLNKKDVIVYFWEGYEATNYHYMKYKSIQHAWMVECVLVLK